MTEASEATMVVTLVDVDDFQLAKKQISRIKGVRSVELYDLSGKLRVRYDRDPKRNLEIQAQIKKIIETCK